MTLPDTANSQVPQACAKRWFASAVAA